MKEFYNNILNDANNFFHTNLKSHPDFGYARRYARSRGLESQDVVGFQLGYAPNGWQCCIDHLREKGWDDDAILASGLAVQADSGHLYDRFRHRLVFPINDHNGRLVGFGGRFLGKGKVAKYVNSPSSETFNKSTLLYGLDRADTSGPVVVVEGYMDVVTAHRHGFKGVVAQMGVSTTKEQFEALRRFNAPIIVALDADAAGHSAVMRSLRVASEFLMEDAELLPDGRLVKPECFLERVQVLSLPEGDDPDRLIRRDAALWQRLVNEATPILSYAIREKSKGLDARDIKGKMEVVGELGAIIRSLDRDDLITKYINQLSVGLDISAEALRASIFSTEVLCTYPLGWVMITSS